VAKAWLLRAGTTKQRDKERPGLKGGSNASALAKALRNGEVWGRVKSTPPVPPSASEKNRKTREEKGAIPAGRHTKGPLSRGGDRKPEQAGELVTRLFWGEALHVAGEEAKRPRPSHRVNELGGVEKGGIPLNKGGRGGDRWGKVKKDVAKAVVGRGARRKCAKRALKGLGKHNAQRTVWLVKKKRGENTGRPDGKVHRNAARVRQNNLRAAGDRTTALSSRPT